MSIRRQVRVTQEFFDRLDDLLPPSRSASGDPSATDFLLHEMPSVIDKLATDFHSVTLSTGVEQGVRALIVSGLLVPFFAVYAAIAEDGAVEVFYVDIG